MQGEVPQRAAPRSTVALPGQERQEEVKGIEIEIEQRQRHAVEAHMEYCTGCSDSRVVPMGM